MVISRNVDLNRAAFAQIQRHMCRMLLIHDLMHHRETCIRGRILGLARFFPGILQFGSFRRRSA
ncbi:hypothetical protein AA103193_1172 [Tanticharoenia sakaeratensis NBRC 103193]|nr:hypothetical protein AA103193_1172 [Tanticharoenia sakaeratensis NBRC 103193]